jgi:hypothetical protein
MSKGKTVTLNNVSVNNAKAVATVTKVVELVVVNDQLVPDTRDTNRRCL